MIKIQTEILRPVIIFYWRKIELIQELFSHLIAQLFYSFSYRPVSPVVHHLSIGSKGPGSDSRAGQIGHNVGYGSPPLRRFFGVVLPRRMRRRLGKK